jgi:hypothetical protein
MLYGKPLFKAVLLIIAKKKYEQLLAKCGKSKYKG